MGDIKIIRQGKDIVVGQLVDHPEVISEGKNIVELTRNIQDAFNLYQKSKSK